VTPNLVVHIGRQQREFNIEPGTPCRIGRSSHNTIELPDDSVSRAHAMIQFTGSGSCYLYDLDSRNGTFVNGARVSAPTVLRHGDCISIGQYHLNFVHEQAAAAPPADSLPVPPDTGVQGESQQVTIAVVDIRNYSQLVRRIGAARLDEVIDAFRLEAGAIFEDMGAWTQKHMDTTVMAVWVHRSIKPPLNVVLAAFESVSKLALAVAGLEQRFNLEEPVHISAGVETGKASIEALDNRPASDLTAFGDAANRALSIDSGAKHLDSDIAFGSATREILLQGAVLGELAQQRTVTLEGGAEPASLWVMSLASLSKMLGALPHRTARLRLP
jgi:adenylate cyclase